MPAAPVVIRPALSTLVRIGPYTLIMGVVGLALVTLRAGAGSAPPPARRHRLGDPAGRPLLALAVALWLRHRNPRIGWTTRP